MNRCADCGAPGVWNLNDPGALPVIYCDSCLPALFRGRAADGSLARVPVAVKEARPGRRLRGVAVENVVEAL